MAQRDSDLRALLRRQYGVVTRAQALSVGMSARQIQTRIANKQWIRVHAGVYRSADHARSGEQILLAACCAAGPGAAASHMSAAWILGLWDRAPSTPQISVRYPSNPRLDGVSVRRSRSFDPTSTIMRAGIRTTDTLTVLSDLAGVIPSTRLESIVDRAIATRLASVAAIEAHLERVRAPGRRGPSELSRLIESRGLRGGPAPSVLEAEALRLFERWSVPVLAREVWAVSGGRYRIDFLIVDGFAVEVDGFAYHWSPEAKARDESRRNQLRIGGLFILVYTWRDIRYEGGRVAREILGVLQSRLANAPSA